MPIPHPGSPALAGKTIKEIEELIAPLPRFRAKQIYTWLVRGVYDFNQMTDLSLDLRKTLSQKFSIFSSSLESVYDTKNTNKIVISLKDGLKIEAVLLESKERLTACLSTQAGCPAACVFCKTGQIGFSRNLEYTEIIEQFFYLRSLTKNKPIDNIVIMGMGEPLLNLAELKKALNYFLDEQGFNFSKRRITVSTCGVLDGLIDICNNGPKVKLALSLTTADEDLRNGLMPITGANPLEKIKDTFKIYQKNGGGRVTLEIPLLGGINTRQIDAELIYNFAKDMETVINIIPWNPVKGLSFNGSPLIEPSLDETKNFIKMLEDKGLKVTMRFRRGRGVQGACGQLGEHG